MGGRANETRGGIYRDAGSIRFYLKQRTNMGKCEDLSVGWQVHVFLCHSPIFLYVSNIFVKQNFLKKKIFSVDFLFLTKT